MRSAEGGELDDIICKRGGGKAHARRRLALFLTVALLLAGATLFLTESQEETKFYDSSDGATGLYVYAATVAYDENLVLSGGSLYFLGGHVEYDDGIALGWTQYGTGNIAGVEYDSQFKLKAVPDPGYSFLFWVEAEASAVGSLAGSVLTIDVATDYSNGYMADPVLSEGDSYWHFETEVDVPTPGSDMFYLAVFAPSDKVKEVTLYNDGLDGTDEGFWMVSQEVIFKKEYNDLGYVFGIYGAAVHNISSADKYRTINIFDGEDAVGDSNGSGGIRAVGKTNGSGAEYKPSYISGTHNIVTYEWIWYLEAERWQGYDNIWLPSDLELHAYFAPASFDYGGNPTYGDEGFSGRTLVVVNDHSVIIRASDGQYIGIYQVPELEITFGNNYPFLMGESHISIRYPGTDYEWHEGQLRIPYDPEWGQVTITAVGNADNEFMQLWEWHDSNDANAPVNRDADTSAFDPLVTIPLSLGNKANDDFFNNTIPGEIYVLGRFAAVQDYIDISITVNDPTYGKPMVSEELDIQFDDSYGVVFRIPYGEPHYFELPYNGSEYVMKHPVRTSVASNGFWNLMAQPEPGKMLGWWTDESYKVGDTRQWYAYGDLYYGDYSWVYEWDAVDGWGTWQSGQYEGHLIELNLQAYFVDDDANPLILTVGKGGMSHVDIDGIEGGYVLKVGTDLDLNSDDYGDFFATYASRNYGSYEDSLVYLSWGSEWTPYAGTALMYVNRDAVLDVETILDFAGDKFSYWYGALSGTDPSGGTVEMSGPQYLVSWTVRDYTTFEFDFLEDIYGEVVWEYDTSDFMLGYGRGAFTDQDYDGMPDWWEWLHGLDPMDASDKDADIDGDGL
ncbi:MAG: hypothetical protein LBS92_01620, partial [Candidatus Methanoplasma sp.]|nr:hypothetical protein [Candidatus Methanoplasma sp.]